MAETRPNVPQVLASNVWIPVVETADAIFYMSNRIWEDEGGAVRGLWEVQDLKQKAPDGVMSMRLYTEFACGKELHRILSLATYSGPMLSGELLSDETHFSDWRPVQPGTASASICKRVCGTAGQP